MIILQQPVLKLHVIFYPVPKKTNSKGLCPLYCRITINGVRGEFSTGITIKKDEFVKGEITDKNPCASDYNRLLSHIKMKVTEIFTDLKIKEDIVTPRRIIHVLQNNHKKAPTLLQLIEEVISNDEKYLGVHFCQLTIRNKYRHRKTIAKFLKEHMKINDISIDEVRSKFADDFILWLQINKKFAITSVRKHYGFLVRCVNYAVSQEHILRNLVSGKKIFGVKKDNKVFLTIEQIELLYKSTFISPALSYVRDLFLFQIFTGLAFADLTKFSRENLSIDADGRTWIVLNRQKNSSTSTIPLFQEAKEIILKYADGPPAGVGLQIKTRGYFYVYKNQFYNRALKEIAFILNIDPAIMVSHTARKTFATTLLNNKSISLESVAATLGHQNIKTTSDYYATVNKTRIGNEVLDLKFLSNKKTESNKLTIDLIAN